MTTGAGLVDLPAAEAFLHQHHAENPQSGPLAPRLRQVLEEIEQFGTYRHTPEELAYGARVAWRNSSRCIGRLYWRSLLVRDRRDVHTAGAIAAECVNHLREATNEGRIRPTITVFPPTTPWRDGPRIWNEQLVRYAGHRDGDRIVGDRHRAAPLRASAARRARCGRFLTR